MRAVKIGFAPGVVDAMCLEAERKFPRESGGVLLGFFSSEDERHAQVTLQIGPGPNAVHRREKFVPDGAWQAEQIARAYEESGRLAAYLGDWHSHPGGGRTPSRLDRSTARRIAKTPEARAPHPLMVILARKAGTWSLAGHRRARRRLRPAEILAGAETTHEKKGDRRDGARTF